MEMSIINWTYRTRNIVKICVQNSTCTIFFFFFSYFDYDISGMQDFILETQIAILKRKNTYCFKRVPQKCTFNISSISQQLKIKTKYMKTDIHGLVLNTQPFLTYTCDLRYLKKDYDDI